MLSVFSYGEVLIDFIPMENGQYFPFVGGAPANVAAAVAKLGGNSFFVGGIGQDSFGTTIQQQLNSLGVEFSKELILEQKTAMVVVSLDTAGERSFQFYRDGTADVSLTPELLQKLEWQDLDIFHFCSNTLTDQQSYASTLYALQQAKLAKALVSFDLNLRSNLWSFDESRFLLERCFQVFSYCDLIKFSDEELDQICQLASLPRQAFYGQLFEFGVTLIVVTSGGAEIEIRTRTLELTVLPEKAQVVDTTAGGDSFIGGFLYQLSRLEKLQLRHALEDEASLLSMIRFAAKCGAHTVAHKGAFDALPRLRNII